MLTPTSRLALIGAVILVFVLLVLVAFGGALRETVVPRRADVPALAPDHDPALHIWSGQLNHNFTAPYTPWDPDSRQQLETAALTAGGRKMHLPVNPDTRIGVTDRVKVWDNPYTAADDPSSPCSKAVSIYDVQPFQQGFLVPRTNGSTDGTPAQGRYYYQPAYWSRESGPYGGPYTPAAHCQVGDENPPHDCL